MITTFKLHPLALFNISDCVRRRNEYSVGVLLGHSDSEGLSADSSFEVRLLQTEHGPVVDEPSFEMQIQQHQVMCPDMHIIGTYHGVLNGTGIDSLPAMLCSRTIDESITGNSKFAHLSVDFDRLSDDQSISAFQISTSSVRSFLECRDYETLKEKEFLTSIESCTSERAAVSFIRKNRKRIVDLDDEDNQYDPVVSLNERINALKEHKVCGTSSKETKLRKMALVNLSLMVEALNKMDQLEYVSKQVDAYL